MPPEALRPCKIIELSSGHPPKDREVTAQFDSYGTEEDARRSDRVSTEVVVWPSAPPTTALAVRSGPNMRVSIDAIDLDKRVDPRLSLLAAPDSPRAKAFRVLRHRLLAGTDPHLIAVTSAQRGDGKTTCAANLALALAEESLTRVLLFEANVRQPALARLFGFEPRECLSLQMARLQSPQRTYSVTGIDGTRLSVAAMSPNLAPGARLDRLLLSVALNELRSEFDYIVVDTSAALESADANVVAEAVDGVIMAARVGKSRKRHVERVIAQLGGAPLLGIALLDAREAR
jgi:Mrp family chromosome partitioning ATPase